jgi:hypothetical protein
MFMIYENNDFVAFDFCYVILKKERKKRLKSLNEVFRPLGAAAPSSRSLNYGDSDSVDFDLQTT